MREFLEKEWAPGLDEAQALKLTVKALLEVVDSGSKNMEVVVVRRSGLETLGDEALTAVVTEVEAEQEEAKGVGTSEDAEMKDS